ncbi:MAG: DoxX family membrane protein, partial [Terriglobales bacterium]
YFLIAGRNRFSVDYFFGIESGVAGWLAQNLAHMSIRLCTGLGLLILGFDEKLVHPQLALELLKHAPSLNFMHAFGMSNDLFILCAGLSEVMVGLVLIVGSFPRLAVLMLAGVFAVTTIIFGTPELVGNLAYYGIIASIFTRGAGSESPLSLLSSLYSLILYRLRRPSLGTIV